MGYNHKVKVEGKDVALNLTDKEVQSVMSIIDGYGVNEVHLMKKGKSAPQIFTDERRAIACQERHKFDYMFTLAKDDLKEYWGKIKANFQPKKEDNK